MKAKILGILPLLLFVPSLMALTPEEAESFNEYSDFTVTIKEVEDSEKPNLYEFTINNYGDCYLNKEHISQKNLNGRYIESFENTHSVEDNFKTLIKPKEVCVLRSYIDTSRWEIEEGEFNDFFGVGYSIRNDIISITGPYNFSISDYGDYGRSKLLEIDCGIKQLQHLKKDDYILYRYFYAIDMTYDGQDFCVESEYQNDLEGIATRFSPNQEIDSSKLKINNIDSFIFIEHAECCEPTGIKIFKLVLIILAGLGIFGIIFGIIAVVIRCVDKKVIKK